MSRKGKGKVPPTLTEPQKEQLQEEMIVPVEVMLHIAACRVERLSDEVLELSLISPTGIGVTARMSQENANELAEDLQLPSKVETFTAIPGLKQ